MKLEELHKVISYCSSTVIYLSGQSQPPSLQSPIWSKGSIAAERGVRRTSSTPTYFCIWLPPLRSLLLLQLGPHWKTEESQVLFWC